MTEGESYAHIKLVNAEFATKSILVTINFPFLEYRIERAMKKLIKREELYKKYFPQTNNQHL